MLGCTDAGLAYSHRRRNSIAGPEAKAHCGSTFTPKGLFVVRLVAVADQFGDRLQTTVKMVNVMLIQTYLGALGSKR
jgi:hypothetical protein